MSLRGLGSVVFRFLLGFAAAGATALVSMGQAGRTDQGLDQLNALLAPLLVLLAILLALALRLRAWTMLAVVIVGLGIGSYQLGGAALNGWRDRALPAAGPTFKVLTFSTYHANPHPAAIPAMIAAQSPDIVLLQEANGTARLTATKVLPRYRRLNSCRESACPLAILSRWPIRRVRLKFGPYARPDVLLAEVNAPFGRFHVANLHLPRPYEAEAPAYIRRLAAVARVSGARPLIMAGDFNTATGSFGLARFQRDSGLRRRDGFIPTYPANQPIPAFAGIDHVFADRRWASAGCRRTGAAFSDHYGVVCRLSLRDRDGGAALP